MRLGVDIGFGDLKVAYRNGGGLEGFKMPTAISYAPAALSEFFDRASARGQGDGPEKQPGTVPIGNITYHYKDRDYLVGEAAKDAAFSTKDFNFMIRYAPLFAFIAVQEVQKLTGHEVDKICLGLPLSYYKTSIIKEMTPAMERITVNGTTLEIPVNFQVQGYGALIDYVESLPPEQQDEAIKELLVIDVGFNTVDFINVELGQVTPKGSGTMERDGVSKVTEELTAALQTKDFKLSPVEAADLLKNGGALRVLGTKRDYSELVRQATERYVDWLFGEIESRYSDRLVRVGKIILCGGGAHFLKHYVPAKYARLVHVPFQPEMANARGFLRLVEGEE